LNKSNDILFVKSKYIFTYLSKKTLIPFYLQNSKIQQYLFEILVLKYTLMDWGNFVCLFRGKVNTCQNIKATIYKILSIVHVYKMSECFRNRKHLKIDPVWFLPY